MIGAIVVEPALESFRGLDHDWQGVLWAASNFGVFYFLIQILL